MCIILVQRQIPCPTGGYVLAFHSAAFERDPQGGYKSLATHIAEVDSSLLRRGDNFGPVSAGETVVGTIGDGLKRLYFVSKGLMKQAKTAGLKIQREIESVQEEHDRLHHAGLATERQCNIHTKHVDELEKQLGAQKRAYDAAKDLFWNTIRVEYPGTTDAVTLGIRDSWVLVTGAPQEAGESFGTMIVGALLTGGMPAEASRLPNLTFDGLEELLTVLGGQVPQV